MNGPATPLSLNEISFVLTRAAVGAGAPFGMGEVFAKASACLACLGLDPAEAAVPALRGLADGDSSGELVLRDGHEAAHVQARDGQMLSAIFAGPVVADRLSIESTRGGQCRLVLDETDQPLLIAAAVAAADIDTGRITVSWLSPGGGRVVVELADGMVMLPGPDGRGIEAAGPARVDIALNQTAAMTRLQSYPAARRLADGRRHAVERGVVVDGLAWSTVVGFFGKCLVPSTAQARSRGAGAGSIDNV